MGEVSLAKSRVNTANEPQMHRFQGVVCRFSCKCRRGGIVVEQLRSGSAAASSGITLGRGGLVGGAEAGLGKWFGFNQRYWRGGGLIGYEVGPSVVLLAVDRYLPTRSSENDSELGSFTTAGLSLRREW